MNYYFLLITSFLLTQFSCVSTMPGSKTFNYCYPNDHYAADPIHLPYTSIPETILTDTLLLKHYSISTINLANASRLGSNSIKKAI